MHVRALFAIMIKRPTVSFQRSRVSSARSTGPSNNLADLLEQLGQIVKQHKQLVGRVDKIEVCYRTNTRVSQLHPVLYVLRTICFNFSEFSWKTWRARASRWFVGTGQQE